MTFLLENNLTCYARGGARVVPGLCQGGARVVLGLCQGGARVVPGWCQGGARVVFQCSMTLITGCQPADLNLTSSLPLRSRPAVSNELCRRGPTPLKLQLRSKLSLTSSEMRACVHQKSTAPSLSKPASVQALPASSTNHVIPDSVLAKDMLGPSDFCHDVSKCHACRNMG